MRINGTYGRSTGTETASDYDNPPVVETILGVQFERLGGFGNAHLGGFWRTLDGEKWPTVQDAPPLEPRHERFEESARWARFGAHLTLTQDPASRLQIKNQDGDQMIQVQNGRLHFNWLGQAGGCYLRYTKVRDGFISALECFTEYLTQANVGDFRPNQWEITYLNHIPKGSVWNSPDDWRFFRPFGSIPTIDGLIQGETFTGEWHFIIPNKRGRLHVNWKHGLKPESNEHETIVLTLTARGPLAETNDSCQAILDGLDLGHETIVRSFRELTTDTANKYWRLKNGNS